MGERMDGLEDLDWWQARQDHYLRAATERFVASSPLNVIDHLERARRDPASHAVAWDRWTTWRWPAGPCASTGGSTAPTSTSCACSPSGSATATSSPKRVAALLADRFTGFRYWYTDPVELPEGTVDERWYWSENHRLIFHTCELLAGQSFAGEVFAVTGMTGEEHRQRAAARLHAWFDEKATDGFSEWHSDVYYAKDLAPLVTLAEFAADPAIAERAAAFLDLVLYDLALHHHRGNVGCTHGRSYMKDKSRASDQAGVRGDEALLRRHRRALAGRRRRPRRPVAVERVGLAARPGAAVPAAGDLAPRGHQRGRGDRPRVHGPAHRSLRAGGGRPGPGRRPVLHRPRPGAVLVGPFSALTPWQLIPLTVATLDRHQLWDANLFALFKVVRDAVGGDLAVMQELAAELHPMVNAGLLEEVFTATWRNGHALLSTALAYRPGTAGFQHHAWQATLDERAVVFTTHPGNPPSPNAGDYLDHDRYWTGSATLPCVVQHGRVAIVRYEPAFACPTDDLLAPFAYEPYTHAFFPTEHFDEVRSVGNWTLGRRRGAFVGLWSWRAPSWRHHDPASVFTNGLTEPFDLVADGGADDVWICELGDVDRWGSFDAFCDAVLGASVEVDDPGWAGDGPHPGFSVRYASPAEGRVASSPEVPLAVDGVAVSVRDRSRFRNRYTEVGPRRPPRSRSPTSSGAGRSTSPPAPLVVDPPPEEIP